ncbi:MAG: Asp-tRNA(Asn)/Glu-tRNA(Gln) amidotransferase subunit GatB [Chloroflexi bacterium]|nr:Asp-tRNA(Asn)/Glu-tRNA(Gln) amidotransferase subunit GatB [Chloroflexota bacterium]
MVRHSAQAKGPGSLPTSSIIAILASLRGRRATRLSISWLLGGPVDWEAVIGLEVHAQLLTRSKMFCACPADYQDAPPNTRVCPVCLGMPGTLPVINKRAVEFVITTGLALNCSIAEHTQFDRMNYPYPDLMKGYQISQYANPIAHHGWLELDSDDGTRVGITRVHLEEDVAKLMHVHDPSGEVYSLVDVNRSGVPLMEVVSEPDMRTPSQARQYLLKLRTILQYTGVSTGDMEKGSFRCDANVSVRPRGSSAMMPKVEVKNMNSFRSVARALEYEIARQVQAVESGGRIVQETRGWLEDKAITISQRTKEYAHDYRYFPEPDLPPLLISRQWVGQVQQQLPELPDARCQRFMEQYGLGKYDASQLTAAKDTADFFESCLRRRPLEGEALRARAKAAANWTVAELGRLLNQSNIELGQAHVSPEGIMELIDLVEAHTISSTQAKEVFEEHFASGKAPRQVVQERGLVQVSDREAVLPAVQQAIAANPQAVTDYLGGKETAIRFLVGQVMKLTKGKANPGLATALLKEKLEEARTGQGTPAS